MKSISIIGSGNVATHLGIALKNKNYQIKQVFSRTIKNANILAQILDAEAINNLLKLRTVDLIIISVKDSEITKIIRKISNSPIVHTSGSVDIKIFDNKFKQYGIFYPVQTFNKDIKLDFSNIPICIETNNKEFEIKLRKLANSISSKVIYMKSEQRKQLHIAAVFSANFSNHMFLIAENILNNSDIRFSILLPLIQQTIKKLEKNKAKDIQTGPAKRNDTSIIKDHLSNIKDKDIREIYHKISENIIKEHE
tara:strand:- start:392 stop:1147 length:756 start_codon:yes stop_codon:yes gene_type:complete